MKGYLTDKSPPLVSCCETGFVWEPRPVPRHNSSQSDLVSPGLIVRSDTTQPLHPTYLDNVCLQSVLQYPPTIHTMAAYIFVDWHNVRYVVFKVVSWVKLPSKARSVLHTYKYNVAMYNVAQRIPTDSQGFTRVHKIMKLLLIRHVMCTVLVEC